MTIQNQNVEIWRGNSRVLHFVSASDLTGINIIRWWMAKKVTSTGADIFVQKSLPEITKTKDVDEVWTIHVPLNPDDTEDVPAGNWYHELEVIDASGRVSTLMVGKFKVNNVIIPADLDD